MDVREWLPRDKHDFEAVRKLSELGNEELRDIIPDLMEWLQDGNWPIAKSVEDLFLRFGEELIPHIKHVFRTRDSTWEYYMLTGLINRLPSKYLVMLKEDLERLLKNPTEDEVLEELNEIIKPLLNKIQCP
ncbi:DUF5071 domain-containing protein [Paenibacillus sp. NPDC057886]|uniref:DUF5071 domain-containing protein n=1 Tax=Paenibacillus sp. NPDC057886 TaxID=3346270 RepID=UPI0036C20D1C